MDAQLNDQPQPTAEPQPAMTIQGWFKQNAIQLIVVIAVIVLICRFLHPLDVLLAGLGLSLIIFIHELGHFLAAKWCDVHVKTFSIGFGPALPFCSFKRGETTYKVAMIPLGGFVAMVGENDEHGDTVEPEDEDPTQAHEDPRSLKNKSVWQRMLIISAGVIMNLILGAICFIIAYMHGVNETPAIASDISPGSAAWQAGMLPGTVIQQIDSRQNPDFTDLRVATTSTDEDETLTIVSDYGGQIVTQDIEPLQAEDAPYPQLGVLPPQTVTLLTIPHEEAPPYRLGSPPAQATGAQFQPGDTIVAMSSIDNPETVTPLEEHWNGLPGAYFDYQHRIDELVGKPITFEVVRAADQSKATITVPVSYAKSVGLKMRMGSIVAVRDDSPAAKAGVQVRQIDEENEKKVINPGDELIAVEVTQADGTKLSFSNDPEIEGTPFDPLRLPFALKQWANTKPSDWTVRATVLRMGEHKKEKPVLIMQWQPEYADASSILGSVGSPIAINGLGLAYQVQTVVDRAEPGSAAERAGLRAEDLITAVRFRRLKEDGEIDEGKWEDVESHQWVSIDYTLQLQAPFIIDVRVKRGEETFEKTLEAKDDTSWPVPMFGLRFEELQREQVADGILDAMSMGLDRTVRSIRMIYQGLYAIMFGRISVKMVSGPITLARASYLIAGKDVWQLLLWMGLISINLAVVNFLPIPVLDGGHMVFLIYEAIVGKPAPMWAQAGALYIGLGLIVCLMLFVIGLDIWRLFT